MARLVAAWIVGAAAWSLRLARVGAGRGIGVNQQYCADLLAPCYLMDYEDAFGEMFCDRCARAASRRRPRRRLRHCPRSPPVGARLVSLFGAGTRTALDRPLSC